MQCCAMECCACSAVSGVGPHLHLVHVVGDVAAIDELAQRLRVQLLVLLVVPNEALLAVRDVQAAIQRALRRGCGWFLEVTLRRVLTLSCCQKPRMLSWMWTAAI